MPRRRGGTHVKTVSRDEKFLRLRELVCFEDLKQRMLAGWPIGQLVGFVQVDNKELTDLSSESLYNLISAFRKSLPPVDFVEHAVKDPDQPMVTQDRMARAHQRVIEKVHNGINEVEELENLYRRQKERIDIDTAVERTNKKLIPSMTQEIRMAKDILESLANLKMDLGISKRHLGTVEAETRLIDDIGPRYGNENVTKVLKNEASRQRLTMLAQRLLLADGAVTSAIFDQIKGPIVDTTATSADGLVDEVAESILNTPEIDPTPDPLGSP